MGCPSTRGCESWQAEIKPRRMLFLPGASEAGVPTRHNLAGAFPLTRNPKVTIEQRLEGDDWLFVVYEWEAEGGDESRRREAGSFRSLAEATKAFPDGIWRGSVSANGNPV